MSEVCRAAQEGRQVNAPSVHPVGERQFCQRFGLFTSQGRPAIRKARRLMVEHFSARRIGNEMMTTEETIALVLLKPAVERVLNQPGKHYANGREGHVRVQLETMLEFMTCGVFQLGVNGRDFIDELLERGLLTGKGIAAKIREAA